LLEQGRVEEANILIEQGRVEEFNRGRGQTGNRGRRLLNRRSVITSIGHNNFHRPILQGRNTM